VVRLGPVLSPLQPCQQLLGANSRCQRTSARLLSMRSQRADPRAAVEQLLPLPLPPLLLPPLPLSCRCTSRSPEFEWSCENTAPERM
jgi:hypothetical protein